MMKLSATATSLFVSLLLSSPTLTAGIPDGWCDPQWVHLDPDCDTGGRRLLASGSSKKDLDKIMSSPCIGQTYTVSLFAESHIALVLEPNHDQPQHDEDGDDGGAAADDDWCGDALVMHMERFGKVVMVAGDDFTNKPLLPLLDNISLETLMNAFQKSESGWDNFEDDYDVIDQNCATFALNMVDELDLPVDDRIVLFTLERLYENGKTIEAIKQSTNFDVLLDASSGVTADSSDEQLLALFADRYLRKHEESKNNASV